MQTVIELPQERADIIFYLALNPVSGSLVKGTGGVRKLRWSIPGKGKRGGVRIIYYYHNENLPLFLLTLYGKSEKSNLSMGERNQLAALTSQLVKSYDSKSQ